jgi:hypothetical protein
VPLTHPHAPSRPPLPVLLAPKPSRQEIDLSAPAMIAWDESPERWHAVSAALPFLKLARSVEVVSVDKNAGSRRASQAEALAYLRCHSIGATARVVAPDLRSAHCSRRRQSMMLVSW